MPTYEVKLYEVVFHTTEVEANNPDEAYNKAYEIIFNGNADEYETEAEGYTGDYSISEIVYNSNDNKKDN